MDTALDVTTVGVDQRTKEVTRNLFLIGDYGAVMKAMIKEQGPDATQTPEYLAMREELQRISADMPKSKADMMLQGLNSTAALGAALTAAAGNYLSKPVGRAGASVTNHLNNIERATLGRGGVKFFTNAFEALGSVAGDVIVKTSAGAITEQTRDVQQARSSQ
jgi:hypothetical protein